MKSAKHTTICMDIALGSVIFTKIFQEMKWFPKSVTTKKTQGSYIFSQLLNLRETLLKDATLECISKGQLRADRIGDFCIIYRLTPSAEQLYEDS
jgi:hypothetical protein